MTISSSAITTLIGAFFGLISGIFAPFLPKWFEIHRNKKDQSNEKLNSLADKLLSNCLILERLSERLAELSWRLDLSLSSDGSSALEYFTPDDGSKMDRYRDSQQKVLDEIRGIKFALIANYPPLEKGANSLVKASNFMLDYTLDPSNTKLPRLFVGGDEEEMDLNPQITINLEKAIQTFTKDVQGELR